MFFSVEQNAFYGTWSCIITLGLERNEDNYQSSTMILLVGRNLQERVQREGWIEETQGTSLGLMCIAELQ